MSYRLGQQNQVIRVEDGASLPCRFEKGVVVALDEHSPFVKEFKTWLAADPANVPTPFPAPKLSDTLAADIAGINVATDSPRWVRQGILGLGELVDLIRSIPPEVTTSEQLLVYLRAIPPCGPGMAKLEQVEALEIQKRTALDAAKRAGQ